MRTIEHAKSTRNYRSRALRLVLQRLALSRRGVKSRDRQASVCNFYHVDEAHSRDGGKAKRQSLDTPVPLWYAVGGWEVESRRSRRGVKSGGDESGTTAPLLAAHVDGCESRRSRQIWDERRRVGAQVRCARVMHVGVCVVATSRRYDAALQRGCNRPMEMVARVCFVGTSAH